MLLPQTRVLSGGQTSSGWVLSHVTSLHQTVAVPNSTPLKHRWVCNLAADQPSFSGRLIDNGTTTYRGGRVRILYLIVRRQPRRTALIDSPLDRGRSGVAGLTTALLLSRESKYQITVAAKHMPGVIARCLHYTELSGDLEFLLLGL